MRGIPRVGAQVRNWWYNSPMVITEQERQTIALLNPWHEGREVDLGIERTEYLERITKTVQERKQCVFILGSRRVGKTMILLQLIYRLIKGGVKPKKILFLSLDNTNLQNLNLFDLVSRSDYDYVFLDEIHFLDNWAQILKSLYDLPGFSTKIVCSGSSSKSIEDKKAFLTGRSTEINVLPLTFREFGKFNEGEHLLNDYLYYGGYPEYVLEKQPNYLNSLVKDIVEKDILKLYSIKNSTYLFDICQILAKQIGFRGSPNKISKVLGLDNKTVVNYIQYLKEVKLIETVCQYSDSLNERLYAPKKYYFNDLGMRNSFAGFSDTGSLVENAVFIKLGELYGVEQISYLAGARSSEVDFVVKSGVDKVILVESKYISLKESVVNSLSKAFLVDVYGKTIEKRIVVTDSVDVVAKVENKEIEMVGLEKFLGGTVIPATGGQAVS